MTVKELKSTPEGDNRSFSIPLLFHKASVRKARNGSEFLMVELGDRTGTFTANIFGKTQPFDAFAQFKPGSAVRVDGHIEFFNERFSPRILNALTVPDEELAKVMPDLVESCPENADALWQEILDYVEAISHPTLRRTVEIALEEHGERFRICPAAISMHHAYRCGLLEHTTHMARVAKAILPIYQEVDPDLAIAGIILHDMGKLFEYEGENAATKTRTGILQGHVVLGYRIARTAGMKAKLDTDLLERLEHIILSHQGELEWGAAAMAATPEAVFVSMVDNLDAKMGMVQRTLRNTADTEEFSERLAGLQAPLLITPPYPDTEAG